MRTKGTGTRDKSTRIAIRCPARMRVNFHSIEERYSVVSTSDSSHNHTLEEVDERRRPKAVKNIAFQQISCGYTPAVVLGALRGQNGRFPESFEALVEAGSRHLTRDDVKNSGRKV